RRLVASLDPSPDALATRHAIAVANHVVTPWSSMIVLVDEAQRQRLAQASAEADAFDREVVTDEAEQITSAPEPTALVLLGVGAAGLAAASRRRTAAP
ncbi:MAG: PEP-CTERM sorting domain-containing protein, partial [Myxococcota bacterium]